MTKLNQIRCCYGEPLWGASIKVHHLGCSRDVEISWVQQIAVDLTSFCWIGAYILKVVFPTTNGSRKCNFYDVGVQQILVYF